MKDTRGAPILPRGRVAKWSKEQIGKLTTLELRSLLANAERLKETEVVALCNELLDARPHGRGTVRRRRTKAPGPTALTPRPSLTSGSRSAATNTGQAGPRWKSASSSTASNDL